MRKKKELVYKNMREEALFKHFSFVYELFNGNKTHVANHLGLSVRNVRNLIEKDVIVAAPRHLNFGTELWLVEKALIEDVLLQTQGNHSEAARLLGMSVRSLYYKLHDHKRYDSGIRESRARE